MQTLAGSSILIVEDELLLRKQIAANLERLGADVTVAGTLRDANTFVDQLTFDFALVDVNLPDGLGTQLLRDKRFPANTAVVIMTAQSDISGAVEAMRLGAADYLSKPFEVGELPLVFGRAQKSRQAARVEEHRRTSIHLPDFFFGTALASLETQLQKILAADRRMQSHLAPVLIQGETGTGKTTIARWLHQQGPRAASPLVEVNCSALPESLAESELFGHERGAFTDARTARMGLFEAASGGALFLDELPSLSVTLQAKVLVAIEDRRIRRLGGNKEIPIDTRIIAASNQDLRQLVTAGKFREDLFHRLDLFRIAIPPLRERGDDIEALADRLLERVCRRHRLPRRTLSATGVHRLRSYAWPGNVRELAHEIERALVFEDAEQLSLAHLPGTGLTGPGVVSSAGSDWFNERYVFPPEGFSMESAILRLIHHALAQTDQNVSAAARLLGVSRDYLRYRLSGDKGAPDERKPE